MDLDITETRSSAVGGVHYTDIQMEIGAAMKPSVYDWIAEAWAGKGNPRSVSGAILQVGSSNRVVSRNEFTGSLVQASLSAMDAGSKDPTLFTLTVRPTWTETKKGAGTVPPAKAEQPAWRASGFRLKIPGLDCDRVLRIEPIVVTTGASGIEVSHVVVTLSALGSDSWRDWLQSAIVSGNIEKSGDLILVAPDAKHEVARIHLHSLGIRSLVDQPQEKPNQIGRVTARLSCRGVDLEWIGYGLSP